MKLIYNHR